MYCKFCNTKVEDTQENGAYCPDCIEHKDWWKNKDNFSCILIANLSNGSNALVWVNYQIDGYAYDFKDSKYSLIGNTNWRRATKQEIIDNIKGL